MEQLINKILLEWSLRVHDGMPNKDNPLHIVQLRETLSHMKLSNEEGIFCEPSSAASLAGLMKLSKEGFDFRDKNIVCILTGNGLKDPATVKDNVVSEIFKVDSDMNKIRHKITSIMKE